MSDQQAHVRKNEAACLSLTQGLRPAPLSCSGGSWKQDCQASGWPLGTFCLSLFPYDGVQAAWHVI